ncbi:RICIN domain-containing protein [Actinoplanes sp. RD1]|uniref:RICIN domain-containing protein n=1 Tax=Actinoplanes sp. RD1 TaxID=3064538 RepID=UPI002741F302|nr:RICIN domain-containing protein [Actinoplanes sp. RD1]
MRATRLFAAVLTGVLTILAGTGAGLARTPGDGRYGFQNYKSGLFIQPPGDTTASYARLVQDVIVRSGGDLKSSQNWREQRLVSGNYHLLAGNSSLRMGIDFASTAAGASAIQAPAGLGALNQQWIILRSLNLPADIYEIRNVNSGKCLGIDRASTSVGAAVMQFTCDGSVNQGWRKVDL